MQHPAAPTPRSQPCQLTPPSLLGVGRHKRDTMSVGGSKQRTNFRICIRDREHLAQGMELIDGLPALFAGNVTLFGVIHFQAVD